MTTPHEVCFGAVVSHAKGVQATLSFGLQRAAPVGPGIVSAMKASKPLLLIFLFPACLLRVEVDFNWDVRPIPSKSYQHFERTDPGRSGNAKI